MHFPEPKGQVRRHCTCRTFPFKADSGCYERGGQNQYKPWKLNHASLWWLSGIPLVLSWFSCSWHSILQKLFLFLLRISIVTLSLSFFTLSSQNNPFAEPLRTLNLVWPCNLTGSKLPKKGRVKSSWINYFSEPNCWMGYWAISWNTILSRALGAELAPLLPLTEVESKSWFMSNWKAFSHLNGKQTSEFY